MYLLTLYFDDETNKKLKYLQNKLSYTLDIPVHTTLLSFMCEEENLKTIFEKIEFEPFYIQYVSIGFLNSSIHIVPVMNESLFQLHNQVCSIKDIQISNRYIKDNWFCHVTLSKHLKSNELIEAYSKIQHEFKPFIGKVVKIGLASSNPYHDIYIK